MSQSFIILEYRGPVNPEVIELLLIQLKRSRECRNIDITTGRRVYALVVECLENILKHAAFQNSDDKHFQPYIYVTRENDQVIIKAGNCVPNDKITKVASRLCYINELDDTSLASYYEHKINRDTMPESNSAGLGFIIIRLKAGNKIDYNITDIGNELTYLEIKITINKYIMRKLIIEQSTNSPKVLLDPEQNYFEISGESRPPDVTSFYTEILGWFDDYSSYHSRSKESNKPAAFNLDFEYFNSSSAKFLLDLCKKIASERSKGMDLSIRWHYEDDDIDMLEAGREMSRIAKLPFDYIQKDKS